MSVTKTARPWHESAPELARWSMTFLVARTDRYGSYRLLDTPSGPKTVPYTGWDLTYRKALRHFRAEGTADVLGSHPASEHEDAIWTAVDIDHHGRDGHEDARRNLEFALHVHADLRRLGLPARLIDSNGKGGYHVRTLFTRQPMADAWRLGKYLVRDWEQFGFAKPPESFPKQPRHTGRRCGSWLRCPGRHHTRDHWSRVRHVRRGRWREGREAVDSLLRFHPADVRLADVLPASFDGRIGPRKPAAPRREARTAFGDDPCRDARLARAALEHFPAESCDDYASWIWVGMCLKQLGDEGYDIWTDWSARSDKFDSGDVDGHWDSFRAAEPGELARPGGSLGLGSLFREAMDHGWRGPAWAEEEETIGRFATRVVRRKHAMGRAGEISFRPTERDKYQEGSDR